MSAVASVHYLDHAATTPMRAGAVEVMTRLLTDGFGNPSGAHRMAREANRVLDDARETLADALGCQPGDIVFTGGGTEADNLAVAGTLQRADAPVAWCSAIEHHAVLEPVEHYGGGTIGVTEQGTIDLEHLRSVLDQADTQPTLLSVMAANNETGVVQPLESVVDLAREHSYHTLLHTDAVQGFAWLDIATIAAGFDMLSISAHKFGGPKGVGALVVRERASLEPQLRGGSQERGRRGGTQNVAGIAAMAAAAAETVTERAETVRRVGALRDSLADGICDALRDDLRVLESGVTDTAGLGSVDRSAKTANVAHLCFEGIESEALLFLLEKEDIMASAASSCSSGAMEPSHVLAAMGVDRSLAQGSLRLSLGPSSTQADVDAAVAAVPAAVRRLKERGS